MNFLSKVVRGVVPLAILLLTACGGGVESGTVAPEIRVTTLAGQVGSRGSADGTGTAASFNVPSATAVDASGNVYVADFNSCTIRKITPAGVVTTVAGQADACGNVDATGTAARFNRPEGITVDKSGNLYVADRDNSAIRKITTAGVVTTLARNAGFLTSLVLDASGNLYGTDFYGCSIRKITSAGVVTTFAGVTSLCSYADGTGTAARFNYPSGIAMDKSGNIYVAGNDDQTIRKITPSGVVTTLAGQAGISGSADGTGPAARFNYPFGIAVDASGTVYVSENSNNTIRKITPDGVVTTLAGLAGFSGSTDGRGTVARFYSPAGLAIGPDGKMYVADGSNDTIRKIEPGWPIGGKVSGLGSGATVILKDTLTDTGAGALAVNANGSFIFDMPAAASGVAGTAYNAYSATVLTQPAGQTCTISNGSGTATTDVTNIAVDCTGGATPTYKLGGTVSGLATNTQVVLQNSNGENMTVSANGTASVPFTFKGTVTAYGVTVVTQPTGQTCAVTGGSGTATADVSTIGVACTPNNYNINVSVSGLTGTLALLDNGTDSLSINANSSFAFATPVAYNGPYNVTVQTQPTGQTCTVRNTIGGTTAGTVSGPVNMSVQCTTNTIGGTLSGLAGTVVLQDNGGDNLTLTADGTFTFATPVNYNGAYSVSVLTQPSGQTCSVTSGGSGTATGTVSNVVVSCVTSGGGTTYTIGGMVNNLSYPGLVLQDNLGDDYSVPPGFPTPSNMPFTFATPIASGGTYSVTVLTNPNSQTCTVTSGGSGTASGNVSNVVVDCVP